MGRLWDYVYWRLPVGKGQFFDKLGAIEDGVRGAFNHRNELYGRLNSKIDELSNEIHRLHEENAKLERILKHYHQQDMKMFWESYRKEGEKTSDAQKRFFLSLPKAQGTERNVQLLETILVKAFVEICEENQLSYWLYAGTLLGAVRHKGFIPWDDDVDTGMAREDIDKLQLLLEDNPDYRLTVRYDPWGYCKQIRFCFADVDLPVFLDVFPFDWCKEASRDTWQLNQKAKQKLREDLSDMNNPLIREFREVGIVDVDSPIGVKVSKIFEKYYKQLWDEGVFCKKEDSEAFLFSFDSWNPCDDSNIVARELFFPLQELEFEGITCKVPNQYFYILRELYGEDIYTFPCGEPHFIHADWKKKQKIFEEEVKRRIKKGE